MHPAALSTVILLTIGVQHCGAANSTLLFMQGSTQGLGDSKLWSLDLLTMQATERWQSALSTEPRDFSSRGALCNGVYYTVWWHLVDPVKYAGPRIYGLGAFSVHSNFSYREVTLPNDYFGVWCGSEPEELVVVMSRRPNADPEEVRDFYVQTISTATWNVTNVTTTPITAPSDGPLPVADGAFAYDRESRTMWMSWRIDDHPEHVNSGATHVLDLATKKDTTFYTPRNDGYFMNSRVANNGISNSSWAVLKSYIKKPISGKEIITLTLADISLVDGTGSAGAVQVRKVRDVSHTANSDDLPYGECANGDGTVTLYMLNVDEIDFLNPSFNLSAIDSATGAVHFNTDLSAIVGQKFAYTTAFVCVEL